MSKTFTVMKRSLLGLSLLLFSLMSLFPAEAKKPVTDPRQAAIVEKMLDSRDYWIAVTSVYPLKQRSFTVSGYTIHVAGIRADGSSLCRSKLPGSVGSRRGHELQRCADYQLPSEKNEAGQLGDYFFRRTSTESCSFTFRIEPNGLTSVSLVPESCESITYKGALSARNAAGF